MLHKLAAVKVIQELEAEETYSMTGFEMINPRRNIKQEITDLSVKNGIECR